MNDLKTLTQLLLDGKITAEVFTLLSGEAPLPEGYTADPPTTTITQANETLNLNADGDLHLSGKAAVGDITEGDKITATEGSTVTKTTIINPKPDLPPDPIAAAHTTYLEQLCAQCNALPLDTFGDTNRDEKRLSLDAVYIDLDTETRIELTDEEKKKRKNDYSLNSEDKKSRPLSALEAADQTPRLVLLGAPGSGKSSFVRQLVAKSADACLQGEPKARFPLFLTLRDLATRLPKLQFEPDQPQPEPSPSDKEALITAVTAQWQNDVSQLGGRPFATADLNGLADQLATGRLLLIFDGLDEVPEASRHTVWLAIDTFLHHHSYKTAVQNAHIIVTCRIRSYTATSRFDTFTAHTLAPFDHPKINSFVQHWYDSQTELGRFTAGTAAKRTANLQQAATANQDIQELATNPLLLTTMAIIHQRDTTLPRERVTLYEQAVDILLLRWQQAREIPINPQLETLLRQKNKIRPLP